jgi:hypothetical protein
MWENGKGDYNLRGEQFREGYFKDTEFEQVVGCSWTDAFDNPRRKELYSHRVLSPPGDL